MAVELDDVMAEIRRTVGSALYLARDDGAKEERAKGATPPAPAPGRLQRGRDGLNSHVAYDEDGSSVFAITRYQQKPALEWVPELDTIIARNNAVCDAGVSPEEVVRIVKWVQVQAAILCHRGNATCECRNCLCRRLLEGGAA